MPTLYPTGWKRQGKNQKNKGREDFSSRPLCGSGHVEGLAVATDGPDPFDCHVTELFADRAADLALHDAALDHAGTVHGLGDHLVECNEVVGDGVEGQPLAVGDAGAFRVRQVARGEAVHAAEGAVLPLDDVDGDHAASLADQGGGLFGGDGDVSGRDVHVTLSLFG